MADRVEVEVGVRARARARVCVCVCVCVATTHLNQYAIILQIKFFSFNLK